MTTQHSEASVLVDRQRGLGTITLNRPRQLNALTLEMVHIIAETLEAWRTDGDITSVLMVGAGDRGFCAGGDVRVIRDMLASDHPEDAAAFFRDEYRMNALIAEYPKPIVAYADGITMGGGIGLAGHASIRIVTERSRLAMPETRIGFTPDVGGTWLLAQAPGRLGEYLGMTGAPMNGPDAMYAGFADKFVPSERLESLTEALQHRADPGTPYELVLLFDETPVVGPLEMARDWIDDAFSRDTVADIMDRLRELGGDAAQTADVMTELSPSSLAVTLASVRAARELPSIREVLQQELHIGAFLGARPDMAEGIRAQVVDKDRNPAWSPATVADLPPTLGDEALAFRSPYVLWE